MTVLFFSNLIIIQSDEITSKFPYSLRKINSFSNEFQKQKNNLKMMKIDEIHLLCIAWTVISFISLTLSISLTPIITDK